MTKEAEIDLRIRVTPAIKAWLKKEAKNNHRSLNGEAAAIIAAHIERSAKPKRAAA